MLNYLYNIYNFKMSTLMVEYLASFSASCLFFQQININSKIFYILRQSILRVQLVIKHAVFRPVSIKCHQMSKHIKIFDRSITGSGHFDRISFLASRNLLKTRFLLNYYILYILLILYNNNNNRFKNLTRI